MKRQTVSRLSEGRRAVAEGPALWIPLLTGLLLMLLAAMARGETAGQQARRTENFNATLTPGSTVRIENVSGDIVAKPGRQFSAAVTIIATAPTKQKAEDLLRATVVTQSREGQEYSLRTLWPLSDRSGSSRHWVPRDSGLGRHGQIFCADCKITAQYEVAVSPGMRAILHTVNGEVQTDGLDGDLELQTVNGSVTAREAHKSVTAHSVNGKVDVTAAALPVSASLDLKTVNGAVLLTLPKDAKFHLSASSMSGSIASTFALPPRPEPEPEEPAAGKPPAPPGVPRPPRIQRRVVVEKGDDETVVVDLKELEKELEQSMKEVDVELRESLRGLDRQMRNFRFFLGNQYSGSMGQGGGTIHLSTLNGSITVLAKGTKESEAKALVSPRHFFSVEIPRAEVRGPRVGPHPKAMVRVAPRIAEGEDEVVRGDVSGDFLATAGGGSYRIGAVSGRVKIVTQAGEIHVASAGAGADLQTYGGDITIGSVGGDMKAQTLAGDVRVETVTGSAAVKTSGGDVRIERVGGTSDVRTGGGDIVLSGAAAGVRAETSGGDIRIVLLSREPRGGVWIRNGGGDVTLTVPNDLRADVELDVAGCGDSGEPFIRSEFPEVSIVRRSGSAHGSGALNGGGPRVTVRTTSGTIRLRKGSAAGS